MAKWKRENGYDAHGNRVIMITEENGAAPRYRSINERFQLACMKVVIGLGVMVVILGFLGGLL